MTNKNLTEEAIRKAAKESKSIAEMCRMLDLIAAGGNYGSVKRRLVRYDIDTSHFTGRGWNKDNFSDEPNNKISIKKKLIRERGHQCEKCQNSVWLELPITLELEHIDGNNSNNEENNLLLLCPNCHAQTKTWRRAKFSLDGNPKKICPSCEGSKAVKSKTCFSCRSKQPKNKTESLNKSQTFCGCGNVKNPRANQCNKCRYASQQRTNWPSVDDLIVRLRDNKESYTSVAKTLGVSDNSVRKYLQRNNIDPKTFQPLDKENDDK
jgi:hypothetical protein